MSRFRFALALVIAALGCAIDSDPPPPPTIEELLRGQLAPALAKGAVELAWFGNFTNTWPTSAKDWTIAASPVPGGSLLRLAGGSKDQRVDDFWLMRSGALTRVTGAAAMGGLPSVVAVGPDALVQRCVVGGGAVEVLRGATLSSVDDGARFCSSQTRFGPSIAADRVASLRYPTPTSAEVQVLRLQGQSLVPVGAPTTYALAAEYQGPQWFGEVADGVIGVAWLREDPWRWEQSDGTKRTVARPMSSPAELRKVGTQLQFIGVDATAAEKWLAWDVQGDGALREAGALPALTGAGAGWAFGERIARTSEVDPRDAKVSYVKAVTLRADQGATFALLDVPPTPCAVRETCQLYGESTLLGVVGATGGRIGVYGVWGWRGAYLLYAAPFADRVIP